MGNVIRGFIPTAAGYTILPISMCKLGAERHLYTKLLAGTPIAIETDASLSGLFPVGCSSAAPASTSSGQANVNSIQD